MTNQIKWAELIPLIGGSYSVGLTEEGDQTIPCLYDFESEVLEEIEEMHDLYQEQIERGERDIEDDWEGFAARVLFDGDKLFIVDDNDQPIEEIHWRDQ